MVAPHLLATTVTGRYMPGLATGLVLSAPVCLLLVRSALIEGWVTPATFGWFAPLVCVVLLALLPLLFRVGAVLFRTDNATAG